MTTKRVTLVPMTEDEFEAYLQWAIPDYAQDNVRSGSWSESEALQKAEAQFHELLPQGLHTPNQYHFTIHDPELNSTVGMLWFGLVRDTPGKPAFLYQFQIDEAHRRRGYGLAALRALEEKVKEMGGSAVQLHVFGHNAPARALYKKAGFGVTNVVMAKAVDRGADG
ncbi:MAG TPA: GNAT family N-acetyltransferase [Anaerolineae bacterium]|nr:GNAT family N-acetyltransferase [Anaerolineae bacterium]